MFTSAIYGEGVAFRLDLAQDPAAAVRAVAVEQLDDAIGQLRDRPNPVKAVHEARKDLKKVRSLLRLAPPKGRRRLNGAFRDIAAQLAGARDADVMVATVADLRGRYAGQLPARTFSTVSNRFARSAAETTVDPAVIDSLEVQREAVATWRLRDPDPAAGIARAYARGREDFRAARRRPTVDGLHEWRKRVKDLWYHASLLEDGWPGPLRALGDEAHALSDFLGDDHDLGVLIERFTAQAWPASVDAAAFVALCEQRRLELQMEAFALGAKVYAEKPDAFERRIARYLVR